MFKVPRPVVDSDTAHSEYSPSGSKRWINCPASISMVRKAPREEKTNFYAEEGTAAHELGEFCLTEQINPRNCIGKIFNNFTVDKDMARHIEKYTDYVEAQVPWDGQLLVESRFSMEHIAEDMFGTSDATILSTSFVEIIDLKYGRGVVVEPEENPQLMLYAIGALVHLAKHGYRFSDDFTIKLTICQPRAPHTDGPIRSWQTTIGALKAFQKKAMEAVKDSKSKQPRFGPSEEVCRWCEAGPFCKARAHHNLQLAKLDFADFEKPKLEFGECLTEVNAFTKEELANFVKHSKALQEWIKSMVDFATSELKAGRQVPGFKLVYGRSNRAWSDVDEVISKLINSGIEEERLHNRKPLSPAQMEKELDDEEWQLVEEFVFKPTGNIVLAPETDARKPVNPHQEAATDWSNEEF